MQTFETVTVFGVGVMAALVVLVAGILSVIATSRSRRLRTARDQILNHLGAINKTMVSLDTIRARINEKYSDEFLESLPDYFPKDLRRAVLRDKETQALKVRGLARVKPDEPIQESDAGEVAS